MFIVKSKIIITQKTPFNGVLRRRSMKFNFTHEFSCSDSWRDFTNSGKVSLPKNLKILDDVTGKPYSVANMNIGGNSPTGKPPLLMCGDEITMDYYYQYPSKGTWITEGTETPTSHLFEGYISEISSKKTIEFKVEDNFWLLKQLACPTRTFKSTDTLQYILQELIKPWNSAHPEKQFSVNTTEQTTFGEFRVGNETVAECLGRLRKTWHFESYFRGNVLYCGLIVYDPSLAKDFTFAFQKNIISDDLTYKRKEDLVLSILASNSVEEETGKTCKDGSKKTKKVRLEVLLTLAHGDDTPVIFHKEKGGDYPPNTGGERMTMPYQQAKNMAQLIELATKEIKKYYYSGFKGKFTTFGIPYVKSGDNITIQDSILPERNGKYKCKGVEYSCGMGGIRQIIQLDYLLLK